MFNYMTNDLLLLFFRLCSRLFAAHKKFSWSNKLHELNINAEWCEGMVNNTNDVSRNVIIIDLDFVIDFKRL